MSSRSKMARKAKALNRKKEEEKRSVLYSLNFRRFTLSVLIAGTNPRQSFLLMLMNNYMPPSPSTFYRIQRQFLPQLYSLCNERINHFRSLMESEAILCFDGAWSHPRNAKQCIVSAIDNRQQKLVDFQLVQKHNAGVPGDYTGPSNLMESYGISKIIERWKDCPLITGYCHDNDGKCKRIIEEYTDFEEYLDGGHSYKSVANKFDKINEYYNGIITEYRDSLLSFMKYLQNSSYSFDVRLVYWFNSVNHYNNKHEGCPHQHTVVKERTLTSEQEVAIYSFLGETTKFLAIKSSVSTQVNESFNAICVKRCKKDTSYKIGWEARAYISILIFNDPDIWLDLLWERLKIQPLFPEAKASLDNMIKTKLEQNATRRQPENRKKESERRFKLRQVKEEPIVDIKLSYKERIEKKKKSKKINLYTKLAILNKKTIEALCNWCSYAYKLYNRAKKEDDDTMKMKYTTELKNSSIYKVYETIYPKVQNYIHKHDFDRFSKTNVKEYKCPSILLHLNNITSYYSAQIVRCSKFTEETPVDVSFETLNDLRKKVLDFVHREDINFLSKEAIAELETIDRHLFHWYFV